MRKGVHLPTYHSWQMMKNRCLNPGAEDFGYYGAKGITVPNNWLTYEGFVAEMGLRPEGMTLDRRKSSQSYSLENCRWATRKTQSRNRDYTLTLTHNGLTLKTWEWAEHLRIQPLTFHHRLWRWKAGAISRDAVFKPNLRTRT